MVTTETTTAPETTPAALPKQTFFKFGVYLNGKLIHEQQFPADVFNGPIRKNVNLRPLAPKIMSDLQYVLRQPDARLNPDYARSQGKFAAGTFGQPTYYEPGAELLLPEPVEAGQENSFSFSLKIKDSFIIERNFKVAKFNPSALSSLQLSDMVAYWAEEIHRYIKASDLRFMWDEYELASAYNLTPGEVRGLAPDKRELLLRRLQTPAAPVTPAA